MRLQVKGKNVEVSDSLKDYAAQKLGKLDKHLNDAARLEHDELFTVRPGLFEQGERNDRALARARRGNEHGGATRAQGSAEGRQSFVDG